MWKWVLLCVFWVAVLLFDVTLFIPHVINNISTWVGVMWQGLVLVLILIGHVLSFVVAAYGLYRGIRHRIYAPPQPVGENGPHRQRLHHMWRFLEWMRDHESERARRHYITWGVWSSRIYALALPIAIAIAAVLSNYGLVSKPLLLRGTLFWCLTTAFIYLWYQGKEPLAYPVVHVDDARKDLLNSIWPGVSLSMILLMWVVLNFFNWMGWLVFGLSYSECGWYIFFSGLIPTLYDLTVNTKITLVLTTIPPRAEYSTSGSAASH
ncbi:MAG TPA: hypothetical protein VN495_03050 [Candidatus Paceibacterota bacterium]|nr:hypothetical protein [Candidatus Paceibacterota bacterium]